MKHFINIIFLILFSTACAMGQENIYNYGKLIDGMDSADVHQEQNDSSPVSSQINKREYFLIISGKDGWSNILTMSNITGYIHDSYINTKGKACGFGSIEVENDEDNMHAYLYMDTSFLSSASETVTDGDYIIILDNSDGEGFDDMNIVITKFGIKGYIDEKYVETIFPKKN